MTRLLNKPCLALALFVLVACSGNTESGIRKDALGEYREHHLTASTLEQGLASGKVQTEKLYFYASDDFTIFHKIMRLSMGAKGLNPRDQISHSLLMFQGESLFSYQTEHCLTTRSSASPPDVTYSGPSELSTTLFSYGSEQYVALEFVVLDNAALHRGVCGKEMML